MMDYAKTASLVIKYVGGKNNIKSVTHCATRLRFQLRDNGLRNEEAISDLEGVKGVFLTQSQFQIIFGSGIVNMVCDEVQKQLGTLEEKPEEKEEGKGNVVQRFIKMLSDIFVPIIPAIVAGGLLMGLNNLNTISAGLIKGGKPADTPTAVIEDGSLNSQRIIRGTLKTIYEQTVKAEIKTPAIIVVGETAAFDLLPDKTQDQAIKTDTKPLTGLTIGITGTASFTNRLETALKAQGAKTIPVMEMEVIAEKTLKETSLTCLLKEKPGFTWLVFTSVNGVELFFDTFLNKEQGDLRLLGKLRFAVIGKATRQALQAHGFYADLMPEKYCSESLAKELIKVLTPSDRVLLARSRNGSIKLSKELEKQAIFYKDLALYHVKGKPLADDMLLSQCTHLVFGSASGVKSFLKKFTIPETTAVLAIGPVTSDALKEAGITSNMEAGSFDIPGIIKRLTQEKTQ